MNKESTKEHEQFIKDLIQPVAACQANVDIKMCIPKEALQDGNNEHPKAEDHQVLDNISHDFVSDYEIQELPGHKSYANNVGDEEIVIVDKEDVVGKVTDVKCSSTILWMFRFY